MAPPNPVNLLESSSFLAAALRELLPQATETVTTVPSLYSFDSNARSGGRGNGLCPSSTVLEGELPIIDFWKLTCEDEEERAKTIGELGKACEEWGFFVVINHEVPQKLMDAMLEQLRQFFELPLEEKRRLSGSHFLDGIRCGTSFAVNPEVEKTRCWRDYLKVLVHPDFYSPDVPPGFRDIAEEYSRCVRKVMRVLLRAIFHSLGLEATEMEKQLEVDSGLQILTGNLYPPCPQPDIGLGMPPHSDHGLLTILIQNGIDGLEVEHAGNWIRVRGVPGALLVNVADHLEIITNGKYKSVLHRAAASAAATRISLAVPHGPPLPKVVVPAPKLVDDDGGWAKYRGLKYEDYLQIQQNSQLKGKSMLEVIRISPSGDEGFTCNGKQHLCG